MEQEFIKDVNEESEIVSLLNEFKPYLNSLKSGKINIEAQAKKFYLNAKIILLKVNENNVGFSAFYCNDNVSYKAYLSLIAVKTEFRRKGYAEKILNHVESISISKRDAALYLEVQKSNLGAINFYKKQNFVLSEEKTSSFILMKTLK